MSRIPTAIFDFNRHLWFLLIFRREENHQKWRHQKSQLFSVLGDYYPPPDNLTTQVPQRYTGGARAGASERCTDCLEDASRTVHCEKAPRILNDSSLRFEIQREGDRLTNDQNLNRPGPTTKTSPPNRDNDLNRTVQRITSTAAWRRPQAIYIRYAYSAVLREIKYLKTSQYARYKCHQMEYGISYAYVSLYPSFLLFKQAYAPHVCTTHTYIYAQHMCTKYVHH